MKRVQIIAEIGSSPAPAWDFDYWCVAAAMTGADAVKAQMFAAEHFPRGEWESKRPLEFPRERLAEFVSCAHAYGLVAGVSVFDDDAADLAQHYCDFTKLAAREQDNQPLIERLAFIQQDKLAFASASEIIAAHRKPVYRSVSRLVLDGWNFQHNFTTLHALQRYPAGLAASLLALLRAAAFFRRHGVQRWGWSSHTRYALDCVLAARLGACVIEKHLALQADDLEAGHSLMVGRFAEMVNAVRRVERRR